MLLLTCFHDADHQRVSTWSSVAVNNSSNFRTDYNFTPLPFKPTFYARRWVFFAGIASKLLQKIKIEPHGF
jgi:hypothetical protein